MVPSSPRDVDGLPRLIPPQENLLHGGQHLRKMDISPSTSRVACLREKYQSDSISVEVSKLMLASCRTKSSQTYDSLFRRWTSWFSERNRNPISGLVADAYLHKEGYQSRSLNAYRSAISSIHDSVDGMDVGKHPVPSRLLKGAYPTTKVYFYLGCTSGVVVH